MLMVYKITNQINNKYYIGSTIRGWKRIEEHKKVAFDPTDKKYNYPLYQAFRKYGLENFKFEILKDNFLDVDEMELYEHDMIIKFDAKDNGYNQTLYTNSALRDPVLKKQILEQVSQKCALVDQQQNIIQIYNSYQDAARQNNIPQSASAIRQVCLGLASSVQGKYYRLLDDNNEIIKMPILSYKNQKKIIAYDPTIKHNHKYFDSILQASNELNVDRSSIQKCIRGEKRYWLVHNYIFRLLDQDNNIVENGITIEEAQNEYNRLNPIINNEQHNITEWTKIYNISRPSYYNRIKNGMDPITALTSSKRR